MYPQYSPQPPFDLEYHQLFFQQPYIQSDLPKPPPQKSPSRQVQISHPYARLLAKKDQVKRRKIWNHALEKSLFSPFELQVYLFFKTFFFCYFALKFYYRSTVSAPHRRTIYIASLEAHVDRLHSQLLE